MEKSRYSFSIITSKGAVETAPCGNLLSAGCWSLAVAGVPVAPGCCYLRPLIPLSVPVNKDDVAAPVVYAATGECCWIARAGFTVPVSLPCLIGAWVVFGRHDQPGRHLDVAHCPVGDANGTAGWSCRKVEAVIAATVRSYCS